MGEVFRRNDFAFGRLGLRRERSASLRLLGCCALARHTHDDFVPLDEHFVVRHDLGDGAKGQL